MKSSIKGVRAPKVVKEETKNYFKGNFQGKGKLKMNLNGVQVQSIYVEDNTLLTK